MRLAGFDTQPGVDHRCGVAWHQIRLRTLASSGRSLWRFYRHRLGLRINSQPLPQLRPPSPLPRTLDRDRQRFPLSTRSSVSTPATAAATPKSLSSGPSITTPASTRLAVSLSKTSNSSIRWRMTNGAPAWAGGSRSPARAQDATLQISGIRATLSERSWPPSTIPQPPAPSRLPVDASDFPIRSGGAMAQRDQRGMTTVRAPYSD